MIETKALERKFVIKVKGKDITIDDPNPKFTLKEVQKHLSAIYPQITSGSIGTPKIKDDIQIFNISQFAGTKG